MKLYWGIFTVVIGSGLYTHWKGLPETYFIDLASKWCKVKFGLSDDSDHSPAISDDHNEEK
uniref:AlNc14C47G3770 protein n=1 Tax=Albugo laibachii Nc14 TaxID=890382 RepID=F0WAQ5_9STRA|nr:AlNc14C47G3770 [Albugo laibachii Nc14]|eukprot:CCA18227.1 AlNc14C47G3770 [Albugo laibachii Nc14]